MLGRGLSSDLPVGSKRSGFRRSAARQQRKFAPGQSPRLELVDPGFAEGFPKVFGDQPKAPFLHGIHTDGMKGAFRKHFGIGELCRRLQLVTCAVILLKGRRWRRQSSLGGSEIDNSSP